MKYSFIKYLLTAIISAFLLPIVVLSSSLTVAGKSRPRFQPIIVDPLKAEKKATSSLHKAIRKKEWQEVAYYMIQSVAAANLINHDNVLSGLATVDSILSIVPPEWKSAFLLIKADYYTHIYTRNILNMTHDKSVSSIDSIPSNPEEWSPDIFATKIYDICELILNDHYINSIPLKKWEAFLSNTKYAFSSGMTVGEFCALQCYKILSVFSDETYPIIYFIHEDPSLESPAQKCSKLSSHALDILIRDSQSRGQLFLLAKALVYKAECLPPELRMEVLHQALKLLKDTEALQYILAYLGDYAVPSWDYRISELPISNDVYIDMIKKSIANYPKGIYVSTLKEIIESLSKSHIDIDYHGQYLIESDISFKVNLFNADSIWLLIYDYSAFANSRFSPLVRSVLPECKFVKAVKVNTERLWQKFIPNATAEIGSLPAGTYIIVPSTTPDYKGIYSTVLDSSIKTDSHENTPFFVSDITALRLKPSNPETLIFVVSAKNGKPIEGAEVKIYKPNFNKKDSGLIETLTTDIDGGVLVTADKFEFEAIFKDSKWLSKSISYNYTLADNESKQEKKVKIPSETGIYHSLDSLRLAGWIIDIFPNEQQNQPIPDDDSDMQLEIVPEMETVKIETSEEMQPIVIFVEDGWNRKITKELKYTLSNDETDEIVAEGTFTSPYLFLPKKDYASTVYTLEVSLLDDEDCFADMDVIMWKKSDAYVPTGTQLWIPKNILTPKGNEDSVNVAIGSGVPDRWIAAVLSSDDDKLISYQWIYVADTIVNMRIPAPKGNSIYQLNFTYTSDTQIEQENIWIFSAEHKTDIVRNAAALIESKVSPFTHKHLSFIEMYHSYDYYRSYSMPLKKPVFFNKSIIYLPTINLHFTGWGYGRDGTYDPDQQPASYGIY